MEKESANFLTGIVLTVWGLRWYNFEVSLVFGPNFWFFNVFCFLVQSVIVLNYFEIV